MFCDIKRYNTCSNAGLDTAPQWFCHSFIALPMIGLPCSRSAQKSAVQVCQVATIVTETIQL